MPVIVSPSTSTSNFKVSFIGVVTFCVQVRAIFNVPATASDEYNRFLIRNGSTENRAVLVSDVEYDVHFTNGRVQVYVPYASEDCHVMLSLEI